MAASRPASCPPAPTCANRCGDRSTARSSFSMIHNTKTTFALILTAAALAAGCASKVPLADKKDVPVETLGGTAGGAGGAGSGAPQSQVATVDTGPGQARGAARVVYFDFDSYTIRDEYRGLIETSARSLAASRNRKVTVEGHTDERGGREYNLALGQKRAETVARAMTLQIGRASCRERG